MGDVYEEKYKEEIEPGYDEAVDDDREASIWAQLPSLLLLVPILGMLVLWYASFGLVQNPWIRIGGRIACEIVMTFAILSGVSIVWRPPWLRRLLRMAEMKATYVSVVVVGLGLLALAAVLVYLAFA